MSSIALLTLGGVAASGLAKTAVQALNQGLSFAAELAKSATTDGKESDDSQSQLEALRSDHAARIAEFADRIRRELESAGIDLNEPLEVTSDGLGGIALAGDHPQRAAIEELLSTDVLLQRDFQRLANEQESLSAACDDALEALSITIPGGTP